ncbi:MAG: NAD(P)-dependent alcohol dehydrogenase [Verrucomicrobiota bacterium]
MKALIHRKYGPCRNLTIEDVERPVPGDDQVLVRVHAAAVNDWDWSMVIGKPFYIRLMCGLLRPKVQTPGVDVAGTIESVGKNVTAFQSGDAVYGDLSESGFGGFAEFVATAPEALSHKPAAISFAEAAAIPHAATLALQAIRDVGQLKPNESLLINGAGGGVGTLGIQIARELGAQTVTGVDHTDKLEMMRSVGFDDVIDYTKNDFTDGSRKYDLVVDTKSNRQPFRYLDALSNGGRYVTVGGNPFILILTLLAGPLIKKLSTKTVNILALKTNHNMESISDWLEQETLRPTLDGPYPFEQLPEAIDRFGKGKHHGKVIVSIANDQSLTPS